MADRSLSVVYRSIASIRLDPENPRLHSKKQVRQIARSIETFGFNVPILVDAQGNLMAGHGRLLAGQLLGMTEVPTIALQHLSEDQRRAFAIADNRLTENSVWDDRLLREQLKTLSVLKLDFSLEITGFEMKEINMRIENFTPASRRKGHAADAILDSEAKPKVTRAGDLWILGRHRVCCADAGDHSTYSLLMRGRQARMVFIDPPCNDATRDSATGLQKDRLGESEFIDFLRNILVQLVGNSVDDALYFICADWPHSGEVFIAARSMYTEFSDLVVWVKDKSGPGLLYQNQHELIFVFRNSRTTVLRERRRTNVWRYHRGNSLRRNSEKRRFSLLQATIKPVDLVADAILDATARGEIVLDPFLGSGTTMVAAERTGRLCYGIEIDPRHVDLIVRRWQIFTSQNAVQESTGRTFNDLEDENRGRIE